MPQRYECDACHALIAPHADYVVRIDVFADPALPEISGEELAEIDFDQTFRDLIEQMKQMSAEELQDQVHRRFEYRLCPKCQRNFLRNPLGLPRVKGEQEN